MQEINSIPDASGELAITPATPLGQTRPVDQNRKWMVAIAISCLLHAAAAAIFLISPAGTFDLKDSSQIEGGDQSGVSVVGSASEGQTPGAMNVTVVPDPQPARPEAAKPVSPTGHSRPAKEATTQAPAPLPEAAKQPVMAPEILVTGAPRHDDQSVAPRPETPASPVARTESAEASPIVVGQPPIPSPRPSAAAGLGGSSETNDARGAANGQETKAAIASRGRKQGAAGDAAAARYSGEVASKLARANRRVSKSAQTKAHSNALVAFMVQANGSISDLQLAKSSGSPELDKFALDLVRQQAPFPPIPLETGISSWRFKAPIGPF